MDYTQNYQLPTWVETDRILRTDFNDMTDKLDAALAGLAGRTGLVPIDAWEVTETFRTAIIPVAAVDWTRWKTVVIDIFPAAGTSANVNFCFSSSYDIIGRISTKWTRLILCPFGQADAPLAAIFWGAAPSLFRTDLITFKGLGNMQIIGDTITDQVAAGTKIMICGGPA